jgi:ferric-dicitrate binding protein FerR (iron transport regulator)
MSDAQRWDALIHSEGDAAARAATWADLDDAQRVAAIAERRLVVALETVSGAAHRRAALLPAVRLRLGADRTVRQRTVRRVQRRLWLPRLAAAAAVLLLLSGGMLWWITAASSALRGERWQAAGEPLDRALPGGGRMVLAPGTLVQWSDEAQSRPRLQHGRVHITCEPRAADAPFIIAAGSAQVRVVGTRFWVANDGLGPRVGVHQGSVVVSDPQATVTLAAGAVTASGTALRTLPAPPGDDLVLPLSRWQALDLDLRGSRSALDAQGRQLPAGWLANGWNEDTVGRLQVSDAASVPRLRLWTIAGDGIQLYQEKPLTVPEGQLAWYGLRYRSPAATIRLVVERLDGNQVHDLPATDAWRDVAIPFTPGPLRTLLQIPRTATATAACEIESLVLRLE